MKTRLIGGALAVLMCACAGGPADAPASLEGRTGKMLVTGYDGRVHQITYVVHQGRAIFGGDFDLGPVDAAMLETRSLAKRPLSARWADNTVYYDYSVLPAGCTAGGASSPCSCDNFSDPPVACTSIMGADETTGEKLQVRTALDEYEALTGVRFVRGAVAGKPYFTFAHLPGQKGAAHGDAFGVNYGFAVQVTLSSPIDQKVVLHEVGHVLGLSHEQQRDDAAPANVTFFPICMESTSPFESDDGPNKEHLSPFDTDSMMIYNSFSFSDTQSLCEDGVTFGENCCPSMMKYNGSNTPTLYYVMPADKSVTFNGITYSYTAGQIVSFPGDIMAPTTDLSPEDLNSLHQMYPPVLEAPEPGDRLGAEAATGDFNGDGYADLAVGAPKEGLNGHAASGAVFIYRGTYTGLEPWTVIEEDATGAGEEVEDRFGSALAAGDLDHDGIDDLVVGARNKKNGSNHPGAIYLFRGDRSGLLAYDRIFPSNLGYTDGSDDDFGYALDVAHVMDVSGVTDAQQVIVGAPGTASAAGRVFVLKWSDTQATYTGSGTGTLIAQTMLGSGWPTGGGFGKAVRAGNLDTDGFNEIVVGAPDNGAGGFAIYKGGTLASQGSGVVAYVNTGSHFGSSIRLGRFRGTTGKRQVAIGAPDHESGRVWVLDITLNSPTGWTLNSSQILQQSSGSTANDRFGAVLSAGDLDGDGISDLSVGGSQDDRDGMTDVGSVWLFHGVAAAAPAMAAWPKFTLPSTYGTQASNDNFGAALVTANFDNQGPADLAIGMPGQSSDTGSVLVMHGRDLNYPEFSSSQHDFTTYLQEDFAAFTVQK